LNVGAALPLWQTGFYLLHMDAKKGDFSVLDYTLQDAYWFGNFTPGGGVYHLGTLKLHSTAVQGQATAEEDLTLELLGAPGAK
jgi:hypothetical protein